MIYEEIMTIPEMYNRKVKVKCRNEKGEIRVWDAIIESWGYDIITDIFDDSINWEVIEEL